MRTAAVAIPMVLTLAACGGGGSGGESSGSIKVTMSEYGFDPSSITANRGKVVFYLVNAGTVPHDLIIRDSSNNRVLGSELISAGDTFAFTIDSLPAGMYTFFCDQPGHESAGMKGTLNVA